MDWVDVFENELYVSSYINHSDSSIDLWKYIRSNNKLLELSMEIKKDKFNEKNIVRCITICDFILRDYKNVDSDIYNQLIKIIYSNKDISRCGLYGNYHNRDTFLLLSLGNNDLKLSNRMKKFAVNEALNRDGTTYLNKLKNNWYKHLESMGITDGTEISISTNKMLYNKNIYSPHGTGAYDIRYYILFNDNWSKEEKEKLIYEFYDEDELYDEYLEEWKWGVINSNSNLDMYYFESATYEDILNVVNDKEEADCIWKELCNVRLLMELRAPSYFNESINKKIKSYIKNE